MAPELAVSAHTLTWVCNAALSHAGRMHSALATFRQALQAGPEGPTLNTAGYRMASFVLVPHATCQLKVRLLGAVEPPAWGPQPQPRGGGERASGLLSAPSRAPGPPACGGSLLPFAVAAGGLPGQGLPARPRPQPLGPVRACPVSEVREAAPWLQVTFTGPVGFWFRSGFSKKRLLSSHSSVNL